MAAVHHLGFWKFAVFVSGLCRHAVLLPGAKFRWYQTIRWWVMAKKAIFNWISKISIFGHVTVIGFNIWCCVPNFIEIGRFVTEIWEYNDFQNGGRPPSWILKICSLFHVAFVGMRFCFFTQNFAEIGPSVDELRPKEAIFKMAVATILKFKTFNFWSRDCNRVQHLL